MSIADWSPTADNNGGIWKEGVTKVLDLNNGVRALKADVKTSWNELPWIEYGILTGLGKFVGLGGNQITFPGANLASTYIVGRGIRIQDPSTSAVYEGLITKHTYTDGGNNVLELSLGNSTLPASAGLRVWLNVYAPSKNFAVAGGPGTEIPLTADRFVMLRIDGSGLQFFVGDQDNPNRKPVATMTPDGLFIGKNSKGIRVPGMFLGTNGELQLVANSGSPITVDREVAAAPGLPANRAVNFGQFWQNGVRLDGGINSAGNGAMAFFDGVAQS